MYLTAPTASKLYANWNFAVGLPMILALLQVIHFLCTGIMLQHWASNNNECAMVLLEARLRGSVGKGSFDEKETFMYRLLNPLFTLLRSNKGDTRKSSQKFVNAFVYVRASASADRRVADVGHELTLLSPQLRVHDLAALPVCMPRLPVQERDPVRHRRALCALLFPVGDVLSE
jgi:hypothetical protein